MKVVIEFDPDKCVQYLCRIINSEGGPEGVNQISDISLSKTDKDVFQILFNNYLNDKGITDYKFL